MTALSSLRKLTVTALVCGLCAFAQGNSGDLAPNGRGMGTIDHPVNRNAPGGFTKPGGGGGNGIGYHNGPILTGTVNAYYIWYGTWGTATTDSGVKILNNLGSSIGGSPYFNINSTYYNAAGTRISNSVNLAKSVYDNYSQGKSLSDAQVQAIVANALGALGSDPNGVYFVLTSSDVTETSGFCTKYCGWHTHATINGMDIKYAFVGNPETQCPSSCSAQSTSPNGNLGADAMASVIAHELEEATTDPDLNAWYDNRGYENADKCAWKFGTTSTATNGSQYNVTLGGLQYLIQQNWVNASGGYCAMSY